MKIVLLVLSGDPAHARQKLCAEYPHAQIEMVQRGEVQGAGFAKQLHTFRALHPDVFAISTERLSWQRGQNLFMLFGSLVGAQQVVMIDPHGAELRKSRMSVLLGSPAKLSSEVVTNLKRSSDALRELSRLEQEVQHNGIKPERSSTSNPRIMRAYVRGPIRGAPRSSVRRSS